MCGGSAVLDVHKYVYRNTYFTIMAPVEYKNRLTVRREIRQPFDAKMRQLF